MSVDTMHGEKNCNPRKFDIDIQNSLLKEDTFSKQLFLLSKLNFPEKQLALCFQSETGRNMQIPDDR